MPYISRTCTKCLQKKPANLFYPAPKMRDGYASWCKSCVNEKSSKCTSERYREDPRRRLYIISKLNAKRSGCEHTIEERDIVLPVTCKYLGIRIDYRLASERGRLRSFDAPSIDRIDPSRGYVPGNVQIISDLANRMKSDATIRQLLAFAEGVLREHS